MMELKEIKTREDIQLLVDSFYTKVREDFLLADIFNNVIQDRWPIHLEKMYGFWQTILLGDPAYHGSPFTPHAKLDIHKEHFNRWIHLFHQTLDEHFTGDKAVEAKWRAEKMAEMFLYKLDYYRNNSSSPIQ